ncbi:MAG: hypothetical protein ABH829_04965 [archaeon]
MLIELSLLLLCAAAAYLLYSDFKWASVIAFASLLPIALYVEQNGIASGIWSWSLGGPSVLQVPITVILSYAVGGMIIAAVSISRYDDRAQDWPAFKYALLFGFLLYALGPLAFKGSLHFLGKFILASAILYKLGSRPLALVGAAVASADYALETAAIYLGELTYYTPTYVQGLPPSIFLGMGLAAIIFGGFAIILDKKLQQTRLR